MEGADWLAFKQQIWKELADLRAIMNTLKVHFEQQSFLIGKLTARINTLERKKK